MLRSAASRASALHIAYCSLHIEAAFASPPTAAPTVTARCIYHYSLLTNHSPLGASPQFLIKLIGTDGNAFTLLGRVRQALRKGGYDKKFIQEFTDEATSGGYKHLLATIEKYVDTAYSLPWPPPGCVAWTPTKATRWPTVAKSSASTSKGAPFPPSPM